MAKKKKSKYRIKYRNAAPAAPRLVHHTPRASRPRNAGETSLKRLGMTAAGAAGSAFLGAFLTKQGWAPKMISGALTALGAGLTWKGEGATTKSVGSGAMSSAGGQLVLMLMDEHEHKQAQAAAPSSQVATAPDKRQADALPPGSLENALERARARLAVADEHA
jgi:hypothetical protein